MTIALIAGDYFLEIAPARGASIVRFDWRGSSIFRPACGASIFDVGCFPLVPFSNRIANGHFMVGEQEVRLAPNFPGSDHPHPLHGFGWLSEWLVVQASRDRCILEHRHEPGEWPWRYTAQMQVAIDDDVVRLGLALWNEGDTPMPAGLGFHPYFLRDSDTVFRSFHCGEWENSADCLPQSLTLQSEPQDWWKGAAVGSRVVDTVYVQRKGPLRIEWPSRHLALDMLPSQELANTVVYTPQEELYFCVEPVNHATDAINAGTMPFLAPKAECSVELRLQASQISPASSKQIRAA